jgi:triosephosphate isomerase
MRKQIAAANWKMNVSYQDGEKLIDEILSQGISLMDNQLVIFAVPFPYLEMAQEKITNFKNYAVAAQNCHHKDRGAYTGEVSAEMLQSMGIKYCIVGHSERREYNAESNVQLAQKTDQCLSHDIIPVFCCGEPLSVREAGTENDYVSVQLTESLFHLPTNQVRSVIIAYEPIWAIGTGKTASTAQAQEMHRHLRSVISKEYGDDVASVIPILYGGSVKASNANELFSSDEVDGGLVGGASLNADEFTAIIRALK